MTTHRYEFAAVVVVIAFVLTGYWGIIIFAVALDALLKANARLSRQKADDSRWRQPRTRWKAVTGLWPQLDDELE